jgi:hypothetical protein
MIDWHDAFFLKAVNERTCFGLLARISIEFSYCLGRGDAPKRVEVGACPCLSTIPDEIVCADINQDDFPSASLPIGNFLRLEITPFFI